MKRIIYIMIAVCLILCIKTDAAADSSHVYDMADIITDEDEASLEQKAADISRKYNSGIYIFIVDDYYQYGNDVDDAARNIYTDYGFGEGSDANGEILLLSMSERDYSLTVHGIAANEAFNEYARSKVIDEFLDDFGDDDWYFGLSDYIDKSEEILTLAASGEFVTVKSNILYHVIKWGVSAIAGIIIALLAGLYFKSKMKNVAAKVEADNYVQDNSFSIDYRNDQYTHSTESRRKIEKSSSSSSSSRSGGFSSSSGKF